MSHVQPKGTNKNYDELKKQLDEYIEYLIQYDADAEVIKEAVKFRANLVKYISPFKN